MNTQAAMLELEEEGKSLSDYIKILRRRKRPAVISAAAVFAFMLLVTLFWPPTYRSTSVILIEEQDVPAELVQSTITSYAVQRIEEIKARIMTISNIIDIVDQYELYSERDRERKTRTEIAEEFRDAVRVSPRSADVVDPRSGRPTQAVIAFDLSFYGDVPVKVQKVTNELTTLFLNENLKERKEQSQSTSSFLAAESKMLSEKLERIGKEIADFKEINKGALPEQQTFNLSVVDRTEQQIVDLSFRIKELEKSRIALESKLTQLSPTAPVVLSTGEAVLGEADRLKALQSEYREKSAKYKDDHPDLVRLKREIDSLLAEVGVAEENKDLAKQLNTAKNKLASLQEKYTADHPEVNKTRRLISQLEDELANAANLQAELKPDNPAYVLIETQLDSTKEDIRVNRAKISELRAKLDRYEQHLSNAPQVEKEYQSLLRDYESTQFKYSEIKSKQMSAELAQNLESERKGERFTLIQPPELPILPVSPNRIALVLFGVLLALGAGIAAAIALEAADGGIYGEKALSAAIGVSPMVVIPYMETRAEATRHNQKRLLMVLGFLGVVALAVMAFHIFIKPIDVMWYILLRKMGI